MARVGGPANDANGRRRAFSSSRRAGARKLKLPNEPPLFSSPLELVQPLARAGQMLRVGYSPYRAVTAVLRKVEPMRKGSSSRRRSFKLYNRPSWQNELLVNRLIKD
jgi:hypothetical protein